MATLTFTGRDRYTTLRGTTDVGKLAFHIDSLLVVTCVEECTRNWWFRGALPTEGKQIFLPPLNHQSAMVLTGFDVCHVGLDKLHQAVLAVSAANSRILPACMEPLHRLEVLSVHVRFAILKFPAGFER